MKLSLIIFIILIEKTEMPHIRKKYPANGKSKQQVNGHHWLNRHSSFYQFHNTGTRNVKNKQKIGPKPESLRINDKSRETFRVSGKWRLFNHTGSKHVNKHRAPYLMKKGIMYSKPTNQYLSNIRSYFNSKFPREVENSFEIAPSQDDIGKVGMKYFQKDTDPFSDGIEDRHKSEIENSLRMLIRSKDVDASSRSKHNKPRHSPAVEEEDEDEDDDYEDDYDDLVRKPSKLLSGQPSSLPTSTEDEYDDSDYEEDYDDVFSQPASFSFGNKPNVYPVSANTNNPKPQGSKPVNSNANMPINFPAKSGNQSQPFPQLNETSGSGTIMEGAKPQSQLPSGFKEIGPNNQLQQQFALQGKTGATLLSGNNTLQQLPYPSIGNSGTFFQQHPAILQSDKDLTSLNTGFNLAPNQFNELLLNPALNPGEVKSNYPVGMEMRPKIGEDFNSPLFYQPNNVFQAPSKTKVTQMEKLLLQKSRGDTMDTRGSTLQFFQVWMKDVRRSRGREIFLVALVIFTSISFWAILAAIKQCQYSKDAMNKYPKKETTLTFLGASKEQHKDLLERIGRIKKYDYLNSEELA